MSVNPSSPSIRKAFAIPIVTTCTPLITRFAPMDGPPCIVYGVNAQGWLSVSGIGIARLVAQPEVRHSQAQALGGDQAEGAMGFLLLERMLMRVKQCVNRAGSTVVFCLPRIRSTAAISPSSH